MDPIFAPVIQWGGKPAPSRPCRTNGVCVTHLRPIGFRRRAENTAKMGSSNAALLNQLPRAVPDNTAVSPAQPPRQQQLTQPFLVEDAKLLVLFRRKLALHCTFMS